MIQTLKDVFVEKAQILTEFDRCNDPTSRISHYYDRSELWSVVVLPDAIALKFLEYVYRLNTEFLPGRLPGNGMCIGDVITHEGETYLTLHLGVMLANLHMLRCVRPLEADCRSWAERKGELRARVAEFLGTLRARDPECLGVPLFQSDDEWCQTYAGFAYIGTPSPEFVEALGRFPDILGERGRRDLDDLAALAAGLADEFRLFTYLPKAVHELRNKISHKGCPSVRDGRLGLDSPAASGGASLHTLPAGDDLLHGLPGSQSLFLVACQAGRTGIPHIGGGYLQGVHYVFLPPATPFFPMVQERIERDPALATAWKEMAMGDPDGERWREWLDRTEPIKLEVIREVVPRLIRDRVLGFQVDLSSRPGVGILRPVVAEAHLEAHGNFIPEGGMVLTRLVLKGLLLETTQSDASGVVTHSYGFPSSVFDSEPAGMSDEGTRGKVPRPKVLLVEDDKDYLRHYRAELGEKVTLLVAESLEKGERLFRENPDVALVVMDACVPGDEPNSMPLVRKIRQNFTGPIIASSSYEKYRKVLLEAGCSHEADKFDVLDLVGQLLNV